MDHLKNDAGPLIYGIWTADLYKWVGVLPALYDFTKRRSHLLWVQVTEGRFLLSGRHVETQISHKDFAHDKEKSPSFFAIVP